MPLHYPSGQDVEPLERLRGGRSDICDDGDRGGLPQHHFANGTGAPTPVQDHAAPQHAPAPAQQHDGGNLGWGDAAWDDAGGFESVLFGHLSNGAGPVGGFPPVIVFEIENLDIDFNTLIQTTQIQNTLAILNAANGGSIDVGGDVTAIGLQSASTENFAGLMNFPDFS